MTVKSSKFIFSILFLTTLGFYKPLWADDMSGMEMGSSTAPTTIELTLPIAEEMALKGNPHIHAADKRVDAAGRQSLQTLAPADPTFMIDDTFANTNMWQVEENLGFPGKSFAQVDVDNAETGKQQAMARDTRREILLQTRQTFWDFYYRQKVYEVLDESQKQWKSLSELLKSRELTGQWLTLKTVRAQMEIANATNDLFTSSQALEVSKVNFNHLFSLPHETVYVLKEIPTLPPLVGTVQDFIQTAIAHNPMVEAAQRELDMTGAEAHVAVLSHLPDFTVALSGTRNPDDTGFSYYGFRVGVSVPLFFPIKQTQATDQANDQVEASKYELTGAKDETTHMVEESYVSAQSAWRLWKLYEEGGLLKQTQRAWKATQAAYRNEQMPLSDFVDNYNIYIDTLKSYYKAQADYGKALADLDYQIGNLPVPRNEKE
jgi:outer membrane protein TolC